MRSANLPVVDLSGPPHARGLAHGRAAADAIASNIRTYVHRFQAEALLPAEDVLERASAWWAMLEDDHPNYARNVAGIAEGARQPLLHVVALNVRYELLYSRFSELAMARGEPPVDGCTAFAALPEATRGSTLIGQNWDWIPEVRGIVLREREADDSVVLSFTEAGIAGGKIGLNSHGLGLAINGMTTTSDAWGTRSMPFHVRCRKILRRRDMEGAVAAITEGAHACAANFLVAQSGRAGRTPSAIDIEMAPNAADRVEPEHGAIAHTNHFLNPADAGIEEPPSPYRIHSVHRLERMRIALAGRRPLSAEAMMDVLREHDGLPNSICRHPDAARGAAYWTVASVVMDLDAGRMWATDGPPCQSTYQAIDLHGAAGPG